MKIKSLPRLSALSLALLLVAVVIMVPQAKPVGANPDQLVDSFTSSQTVSQPGVGSIWGALADGTVLGGEREITVTVTAGSGTLQGVSNSPASTFSHNPDTDNRGSTLLTYDGSDNHVNLNPSGLGPIDLSADNAFLVSLHGSNFNSQIVVTIYSGSATTCSSQTKTANALPYGETPRLIVFPYSGFALGSGCSSSASFSSVGAITVLINTTTAGNDVAIDLVKTGSIDLGDLPSAYSMTVLPNGAAHAVDVAGLRLGSLIDGELDGQPHANAAGDDLSTSDDEDGVIGTPGVVWTTGAAGGSVRVTVTGGNGCLYGWIDWNGDNNFTGTNENIIFQQVVTPGTADYTFTIPGTVSFPNTFLSRFRLLPRTVFTGNCDDVTITDGSAALTGQFPAGEVEDHRIGGAAPSAVNLSSLTANTESNSLTLFGVAGLLGVAMIGAVAVLRRRK
ncbi:MAG: hypothetical protein HZC40_19860 [Chloroflexi bacterium]|nr:hypothetical protein [Chloroflexota bacterium]